MSETDPQESDQLPEEGPGSQVPDDESRAPARSSEAEREGQGESRGSDSGDETAQTGNPDNAG